MSVGTVSAAQVEVHPNSSTAAAIASQPAAKTEIAIRRRAGSTMMMEMAAPSSPVGSHWGTSREPISAFDDMFATNAVAAGDHKMISPDVQWTWPRSVQFLRDRCWLKHPSDATSANGALSLITAVTCNEAQTRNIDPCRAEGVVSEMVWNWTVRLALPVLLGILGAALHVIWWDSPYKHGMLDFVGTAGIVVGMLGIVVWCGCAWLGSEAPTSLPPAGS